MRKFNLKGKVVERMLGVREEEKRQEEPQTTPVVTEDNASPGFADIQGSFRLAWRTDVGRLRKNNQDTVILGNGMAGVADGMGGHNGGEIASAGLRDGLLRETKDVLPSREALEEAVRNVNLALWEQQEKDSTLSGMGTTLTLLWPDEKNMIIGQVGDSRAYLIRNGEMKQVTDDHSLVADMVRKGVLTEEQAACHPMRNYITRAVGTEETIETDIFILPRQTGDLWLVCSDGLHGLVDRADMLRIALKDDLEEAAESLLQAALENGGRDNISLVLLRDDTVFPACGTETDSGASELQDPQPEDDGIREVTPQ